MNNGLRHGLYSNKVGRGPYLLDKFGWNDNTQGFYSSYKQPSCAFSVRRLSSTYTGPCMKVRRSSDNAEQDIYFIGEELDQTALKTFCGSGNGFVRTWYDQSGNGRHINQTTNANQPRIVVSGVIFNQNAANQSNNNENKPSVDFVGATNHWLSFPTGYLFGTTNFACFFVIRGYTTSNGGVFGPQTTNSTGMEILQVNVISFPSYLRINNIHKNNNTGYYYKLWEDTGVATSATPTKRQSLCSIFSNQAYTSVFRDGHQVLLTDKSGCTPFLNFNGIYSLGRYNAAANCMNGDIQEFIIFENTVSSSNSEQSFMDLRIPIENNINKYFNLKSKKFI